ncbi:unnamed protein product, partial [Hapterophycus canaliculatus]
AEVLTPDSSYLLPASSSNQEAFLDLLEDVKLTGSTNFEQAFITTFDLLERSRALGDEASSNCTTAILLLTDGEITEGLGLGDSSDISTFVRDRNA